MNLPFFQLHSIKTRMTLFTLAIFVLSIWAISFYASRLFQENMQRALGEQQFEVVSLIAAEINEEIEARIDRLQRVAQGITPAHIEHPSALQTLLQERPNLITLFNDGVAFGNVDGTVLADFPQVPGRIGANFKERDYVIGPLKEGKVTIGKPIRSKLTQNPSLVIAVPVRDASAKVIGVLTGVINLGKPNFLDKITQRLSNKTGTISVISSQHRMVVTSSDKALVLFDLPAPGVNPYLDRNMAGFEGSTIVVNVLGVEQLASVKKIPAAQWYLFSGIPTADVFAPVRAMQQRALLAAILLTLLAGLLTWWMMRRELSPLLNTAQILAHAGKSGALTAPLPIVRQDEVGALVGGFNRLLGLLQQREQALKDSEQLAHAQADALAQSESRLSAILDDTKVHLWVFDGNRYTYVNKQWFDFTGQDPAVGLTIEMWTAVVHPDDLPQATAVWLKHWASKTEHDNYFRLRRHDGVYRDFHCHTLPVLDAQGVFLHFQGFNLDITERKHAERLERFRHHALELVAGDAALEQILRALVLGVQEIKPEAICSVLLLSADGKHLGQGVAPGLPDFYNAAIDGIEIGLGVGSCGSAAFTAERVVVEDIQTHPFWAPYKALAAQAGLAACWSQPIRGASGQVLGTFAIYHREPHAPDTDDVALIEQSASLASIAIEKRRAAEALRISEQRLALAVSSAHEGIWDMDLLTGEVFHSPGMAHMLGYTEDELPARLGAWNDIAHPDDAQHVYHELDKHFKNADHPYDVLMRLRHKDGSWRWVHSRGQATRDAQGRAVRMSGTQFDVTERKQLEDQVRQLAFFDPLTGLPNRRMLNDRLAQAMAASKRSGLYGALMFLDLDNFKPLNDTHGHSVGDLLLIEVAHRLSACVREIDTVARLGGDEFVVMLGVLGADKTQSTEQAAAVAEKIRASVAEPYRLTVTRAGEPDTTTIEHHCSVSMGVVVFINHEVQQIELMKRADAAMYQAKDAGRNTIRFYA